MRVLVTGANGFVGRHLAAELNAQGHTALAFDVGPVAPESPMKEGATGDIAAPAAVKAAVRRLEPDACVHLAGCAFVPAGASAPQLVLSINLMGTVHVLEAFRECNPRARLLVISSAQVYGSRARPGPLTEDDALEPDNLYGISKSAADQVGRLYATQYGMDVMTARPYNHIGPGQSPQFVVASFAHQLREFQRGAAKELRTGNLESRRDFTDVRDVARAYRLLLEKGRPGQAYNIASGNELGIGEILERMCAIAGVHPPVIRDESLFRVDHFNPLLDITRLRKDTGWEPLIPLERTLRDILNAS